MAYGQRAADSSWGAALRGKPKRAVGANTTPTATFSR
jgi:hypothetical protein